MKKTLKRTGAIGLAAATILTGLSFGPAAMAAPTHSSTMSTPVDGTEFPFVAESASGKFYAMPTYSIGAKEYTSRSAAVRDATWMRIKVTGDTFTLRHVEYPERCFGAQMTWIKDKPLLSTPACSSDEAVWRLDGQTMVNVAADAPVAAPATYNRSSYFSLSHQSPLTFEGIVSKSYAPSYNAADDTVTVKITGGEKNANVYVEDMAGGNGNGGADRTDANGDATITLSPGAGAGATFRLKYGASGTWETVSTGRLAAISDLQVVRGDDGKTTVSGKATGDKNANIYIGSTRLGADVVQTTKANDDNTFSFVLNDAASALSTGYIYNWQHGVRTQIAINGFSATVDSTDIPNRTAQLTGTAVPGAYVVINGEDQVRAGTDGTWSYQLTDLKLGSNPVTLEQYEGTDKTGETTIDAELKVAPVTGAASFPADHGQDAVLSGTAQPGATVVIRDLEGTEIARTEARLGSGTWSTPITAPNAGGDYDVRVHQEIDGEATGEIVVTAPYGAAVQITTPVNDAAHDGGPVTLRGTGEIGAQVAVREEGRQTVLGTAQVLANGQWTIRTSNVDDRKHVLEATQSGKGNNTTVSTVTLNPENDAAAPADLTLTSHEDGDTFAQPGTTTLSGKATPKATVTAYWFGKDYPQYATTTTADDQGDYSISRNMGGTQPYNITLTQTAQAGKVNEVTVRLVPAGVGPVDLTVTSHKDGDAFAPTGQTTISGKASSNATVTFYWFGKGLPQYATTTVANAQGDYSISRGLGGTKPYDIVITQPAQAGKISEVTLRLTPAATGPADLTVTSHQDGDAFAPTGQTTIRGKASSNATVTFYWFGKGLPQYATTTVANAQGDYTMARGLGGTKPYDIVITQPAQAGKISETTLRLVPTPTP